jgi:ferredoxin, 2Fe-2S
MPNIIYLLPDGSERVVDVPSGQSVMDGSVRNNLPGIVAECGGSCACATCHVFVEGASTVLFDETTSEENDLLEFLDDVAPNSRLSCQLIVSEAAAGARIRVADSNG